MEQAINQFNKCLQMDTHPMIQGNDTLSDALNATFVTMNGNEVILQNDMGNRKIDNAYLPEGYEPVGIKEYGGIIYIAAYNPLTNHSQIGSFPSPERRISKNDDPNLGGTLELNYGDVEYNCTFKFKKNPELYDIKCLIEDTVLIPLTSDTSLHAGDKFIVYTNNAGNSFQDVTNYNNFIEKNQKEEIINKVISPKNKQYTLSLGILNSQNEFVDITNSLVRWDKEGNLIDTSKLTEIQKFNIGYFIRESKDPEKDPENNTINTIKDQVLNEERNNAYQLMNANTYSYKLVGPLYIQARLNHIQNFSYNISGKYDDDEGNANIFIEGIITYNCPDGLSFGEADAISDSTYIKYLNGKLKKFIGFDFWWKKEKDKDAERVIPIKSENPSYSETKYDPSTNLYTVKLTKEYQFTPKDLTRDGSKITQIDYVLGVCAINDEVDEFSSKETNSHKNFYYLSGLSSKGTIDLTKFGSGEIFLNSWRFINEYENNKGTIKFGVNSYPKPGEMFSDLRLKFTNVADPDNIYYKDVLLQNQEIVNVSWIDDINNENEKDKLWKNALYKVNFIYNVINTSGEENIIKSKNNVLGAFEFYLTTDLFNDCYDKILDFGNPKDENGVAIPVSEIHPLEKEYAGQAKLIADKLLISPGQVTNVNIESSSNEELRGSLLAFVKGGTIKVESTQNCNIKYTFDTKSILNLKQLYPSWIKVKEDSSPSIEDVELIEEISESNKSFNTTSTILNTSFQDNVYNVDIKLKDLYQTANTKEFEGTINSAFDSFANYIKFNFSHSKAVTYSGFMKKIQGKNFGLYFAQNLQDHSSSSEFSYTNEYKRRTRMYLGSSDLGGSEREAEEFYILLTHLNSNYEEKLKECFLNILIDEKNNNKIFALSGQDGGDNYCHGLYYVTTNIIGQGWEVPGEYFSKDRRIYLRLLWRGRTKEQEDVWAFIDTQNPFHYYEEKTQTVIYYGQGPSEIHYPAMHFFNQKTKEIKDGNTNIESEAYDVDKAVAQQLINKVFPRSNDIYYCRFKKIDVPYYWTTLGNSVQKLFIPNETIDFNQYIDKIFTYYLKYKAIINENSIKIDEEELSENILNFCVSTVENKTSITKKVNFYTGQKFKNYLTSSSYDCMSLKDGINRDSEGNPLDPNCIYYRVTDGLGNTLDQNIQYYKLKDVPLIVGKSSSNENALLCVPEKGELKYWGQDVSWHGGGDEDLYKREVYDGLWRINIEDDINQKIDNCIN